MPVSLYDTQSRSIREIRPDDGKALRFYCCGPTVYAPAHIGNLRTFLLQDVFRRTVQMTGTPVIHVRNLTDVDDKTIRESRARGVPLNEFTRGWTERFHRDAEELNMLVPAFEPAATEHIDRQIELIQCLIDRGHAYATDGGSVYFRVTSFDDYGRLSRLKEREITTDRQSDDENPEPIDADEYERDSGADFALWKAHKEEDGDVFWESPWGRGRPGWHVECSAMSMAYLGESFDVHGGGIDLIFPHHENEIAQSEACTGKHFARHWFHCAHLMVEGQKMSKSLGNLYTIEDIQAKGFTPMAMRYVLVSAHYRQQLNFTLDAMKAAESALKRLRKKADALMDAAGVDRASFYDAETIRKESPSGMEPYQSAWEQLLQDLNTPAALGEWFRVLNETDARAAGGPELRRNAFAFARLLYAFGLNLHATGEEESEAPEAVRALAEERWQAKKDRDFARADKLREEIAAAGWNVLDRKDGYDLEPRDINQ